MALLRDLSTTWPNDGADRVAIGLDVTDAGAAAGASLIRLKRNGATAFDLKKTGIVGLPYGSVAAPSIFANAQVNTGINLLAGTVQAVVQGVAVAAVTAGLLSVAGTLVVASGVIAASAPVAVSQTWNSGGTTFKASTIAITDTASAAGSLLAEWSVGGTTMFAVDKAGQGSVTGGFKAGSAGLLGFTSGAATAAADAYFTRRGAANVNIGGADAAAPVAQTISVQGVAAGTANTAGPSVIIQSGRSTGNQYGGSFTFQTSAQGGSGSAQNAWANTFTIGAGGAALNGVIVFANNTPAMAAVGPLADIAFILSSKGTGTLYLATNNTNNGQVRVLHTASSVHEIVLTGAAAGANPRIGTTAENLILGTGAALATNATAGHILMPTCAGVATGAVTAAGAGKAALVWDSTNKKLMVYDGAWVATAALT